MSVQLSFADYMTVESAVYYFPCKESLTVIEIPGYESQYKSRIGLRITLDNCGAIMEMSLSMRWYVEIHQNEGVTTMMHLPYIFVIITIESGVKHVGRYLRVK